VTIEFEMESNGGQWSSIMDKSGVSVLVVEWNCLEQIAWNHCTHHVTAFTLSLSLSLYHIDGWTGLPTTRSTHGIGLCQSSCVGCHRGIRRDQSQHRCHFATKGFLLDQVAFLPCGTMYHLGCIRAGEPFQSRLPAGRGLTYPRLAIASTFICESCTVRA
jgi:hypothetical protein